MSENPAGYWTLERLHKEALKFSTKRDFRKLSSKAYSAAKYHKLIPKITGHMLKISNGKARTLYSFEFDDRSVYVGISCNIKERLKAHGYKEIGKKYRDIPCKFHILKRGISPTEASSREVSTILKYRSEGWNVLNKTVGGELGAPTMKKWSMPNLQEEASNYTNRAEFKKYSPSAYSEASREGILSTVCSHMEGSNPDTGRHHGSYWNETKVRELSSKYVCAKDLISKEPKVYRAAVNLGINKTLFKEKWRRY